MTTRIDRAYAAALKALVQRFTQPVQAEAGQEKTTAFNTETCRWACETLQGQSWLLAQLNSFRQLEWQYHSQGQTHLAALKNLLRSLFQVISGEVFSNADDQPYRKADGGTFFLDEVGELSNEAQSRLLTLLEQGEIHRQGSLSPRRVDVRVIASSQMDLPARVTDGRFR